MKVKSEPQNHSLRRAQAEWNIEYRMSKDGIASGFAFGYDPTGRSVFHKIDRIHYSMFDVGRSMFDVH
jgi:hypothetical protein